MISVIHSPADVPVGGDAFPIPAGGHRMEMNWERVSVAFEAAARRLGWNADLEIHPEKQYVLVRVPADEWPRVTRTTSEFYELVEEAIGTEQFMSIWIDFASLETCSIPPSSSSSRAA